MQEILSRPLTPHHDTVPMSSPEEARPRIAFKTWVFVVLTALIGACLLYMSVVHTSFSPVIESRRSAVTSTDSDNSASYQPSYGRRSGL